VSTPRDTIHYAGFRVRVDSLEIRWCRGAFQSFTVSGLLRLPPTLSKPATWAQLDSLRLRLTCDASWNWLGTLDIFGGIQLDFGSYARLILHNGRIAKVAPSGPRRGYVEFTVIRLQAPPANSSSYVEFSGLRIWNNGDVELESAEGWINVSRWGNLTIAGITLQVQEVGLGYHQPSGNCSDSLKHWWVGFSGGVSIDAASGLPGGGSGVRVRRLRIYDNGCMQSEGAAINITVSGAFALRGELLWGTIRYGSGSGTVTASGILGQLSAAFYALGGFEAQVDFALGSVTTGTPYPFWFLQGAAVVPGGVPIVPGVFHLVGGIVGAGWRVKLDPIDTSLIRETAGIVPPPPLVPDASRDLLLRGGLIFADPSLQLYRLSTTATVNFGSGLLLGLDGNIRVLPTVRLAEGTASATISLPPGGNLRGATIWLAGNVNVNLLVTTFESGFSAHLNSDCFQFSLRNQWILVDLDHNIGIPVLGAQVVAKAYTSLDYLSLRVCPTSAAFAGSFSGAGVVGVMLNVLGTHEPFHFGLGFGAELCGYYLFRFSRSDSNFVAETKLGGALGFSVNADYSGWYSWGWKGTQAYDHLQGSYCGSGNWVDLSRHWAPCLGGSCSGSVEKCKTASIELRARGVFRAQLTIPQTCFTDASGRRVCLPQWHSSSLSVQSGYYGYGRAGDKEGAKKGGALANEAEGLSCASLASERSSWASSNAQQQQPPALVVWSTPGRGQTGIPIEQPLRLQLGAPVAPAWSAGGTGTCQWQLRDLNCRLYEVLPGGGLRDVSINVSSRGDSVVIRPERQVSSTLSITTLMPNTRYRLIISGDWWARCPGGSADGSRRTGAHDTLEFTTGAPSGWRFWVARLPFGRFRDTAMSSTPPGIVLWVVDFDQPLLLPLEFGRDLWLRVRDSRGRTWEWRGPTGGLIQSAERGTLFGVYAGHELTWDTLQLQPIVVADAPDEGFAVVANQVSFTILNAKKSGSTATRPDTADRLLDALPLEIDRWNWTRLPALAERSLQLSTQLSWQPVPVQQDEGVLRLNLRLRNTGARTIFAGTPFAVIVRKNIAGSVTEQRQSLLLPRALPSGGDYTFSVSLPAEPGLQGLSVWVLPRSPFSEAVPSDNCVEHGVPGDASCTPGAGVPAVQPE
jgi:hypothetical protein